MADHLKIDSFDGRGYTSIIDIDGNFVVNRDRSAGIDVYKRQGVLISERGPSLPGCWNRRAGKRLGSAMMC